MKNWFKKLPLHFRLRRRITASALAFCMVFSLMPAPVFAVETAQTVDMAEDTGGLCEHHTEHTPECGYTEAIKGLPCMHIAEGREHSEECYKTAEDCVHEHTADCYDDAAAELASDNNAGEPVNCTHVCSQDSGCITKELDCPHEKGMHDDECGYAAEAEGTPCTFVCQRCHGITEESAAVKAVQTMLDRLPAIETLPDPDSENFAEYLETLKSDVEAARRGYDALTEEEKTMLTSAGLERLTALEGLLANMPVLMTEGFAISTESGLKAIKFSTTGTFYLTQDITLTETWTPISMFSGTLDGAGYTIRGLEVNTSEQRAGLFTSLQQGGTIKDLNIEGTIETTYDSGGRSGGIVGENHGTITNCTFSGKVWNSVGNNHAMGGICGINTETGILTDCTNAGEVARVSNTNEVYVGGIAGSNKGTIDQCTNSGSISAVFPGKDIFQGHLVGSYAWTKVGCYIGGIAGDSVLDGVTNCTNSGSIAVNGVTIASHTCNGIIFDKVLPKAGGKLAAGNYYLDNDVTLEKNLTSSDTVNLCLNGHTLTGADGSKIISIKGGILSLYDCSTDSTGKITGGNYGGVLVDSGVFNLYSGSIADIMAGPRDGGGVKVDTNGTFNMTGGAISGNAVISYSFGGGVWNRGSFQMTGGEITCNSAPEMNGAGGGIYVSPNAASTQIGGSAEISGNSTGGTGGGVYMGSKVNLAGTAKITGNTDGTDRPSNLYLADTNALVTGTLTGSIGVTVKTPPAIGSTYNVAIGSDAYTLTEDDAKCFVSDAVGYDIKLKDKNVVLQVTDEAEYTPTGAETLTGSLSDALKAIKASGGSIKLQTNVSGAGVSSDDVNFTAAEVNVDLNGKTWTTNYCINVMAGSTLTVSDSTTEKKGKITAKKSGTVYVDDNSTLNLTGGTLVSSTMGFKTIENRGSVNINGGNARNTMDDATVDNKAGGTFTLINGSVENTASGVALSTGGISHISGGILSSKNGYTVINSGRGVLHISGGTLSSGMTDGWAITNDNAIYLSGNPAWSSSGGTDIKMNSAKATLTANNGKTGAEQIYSESKVKVACADTVAKEGYVVVQGLKDQKHSGDFTLATAPGELEYQYDDTNKQIKVVKHIPTYTITASPAEKKFGIFEPGYTPPAAQTITVTNTGNTGVVLTQPTSQNFTIGTLSSTTVAPKGIATFTIQPKPGLSLGDHFATITISTDHNTSAQVSVGISVRPPSITGFTFTETSGLKEEQNNVKKGAVAGVFTDPQGGTAPFTYVLSEIIGSDDDKDNGKFTISGTNLEVQDKALTEGTYKAYVLVEDAYDETFSKAITVTVAKADPRYTITASPTEKDFGKLVEGYAAPPAAQTITITNTGNQTMTLTQPTGSNFTIGTLSSTTIERDKTATFTIQPKPGLKEKVYNETITISTGNNTSASVTAKFEVTLSAITGYTFTQTAGLQEEKPNVKAGAVAGTFSAPQGGTGAFTYTLTAHTGDDTNNGRFTIDGTNLKVGSSALTGGTYKAYVLATDTKGKTFGKAITITVTKADPRYTITASPAEKDFGKLVEGYAAPPSAQTITITNTGNQTITLTQPIGTDFIVGALSSMTIAKDETATFSIQPKLSLKEKVYNETITINTGNNTSASVTAKFEVTLPAITGYTFTQTAGLQEEKPNVKAGAVAGAFSAPQGGTGAFTYTLTAHTGDDTNNGRFTIDGTSLKVGSSALTEGTYKAYVLATDTKGKTFGKAITITVTKADPRYTITASPAEKDFGKLVEGYAASPAAQTITITNTGNQTMTLTQPTGTNFTIGTLSSTTIAKDKTATFTIQPKLGLKEKVYSEAITIKTGNNTSASVTAKFEVTLPAITGYTFTQTAGLQEEKPNVKAGAVAGIFSAPQGGTGAFTYTLTAHTGDDTNNGRFTIDGTSLKVGSSALTEGTYKAYVLATDTKGKTFGKAITITVTKADPRYTITVSPAEKDFGKIVEGYAASPAAQTITITNTGNQTMTLTQPTGTNFTIGTLSSTTIDRDKTATFTIQPKLGLKEKVYNETITINTGNATSASVKAKFEVTLPAITGYTFTQTAGLQEEKPNVKAGAVAGAFSAPQGGTGAFTYTLTAHTGDDTNNGRFTIDGTNLKVGSSALTEGTYKAYVLATDTKGKTFGKAITITVVKADPRYTITASPSDADFGELVEDYTASPAAQTITITNTGNQTMTLTQPTGTNFTIGTLSSTTIAKDKTATFTIQPKPGLKEKVYSETITIKTGNNTSASVTAKFEVTLPVITSYTFTQTAGLQEEEPNVKAGAVAGAFSDPKGGTGAFTYTLTAHTGDDTDNGRFEIAGTDLKVKSTALTEGTYKVYVLATDTKGKTFGKAISITVVKEGLRYTITASPSDADFGELVEDYTTSPEARTITITNTGNQTMTLTQPTGTNFTIGALSSTTIARDKTATFTIQPKLGLKEKEYNEIITINTGNNTSASVTAKFEVTLPAIDSYTFTQTAGLQEEKPNVAAGAVAGAISDPKGGTGAFTYALTAHTGDDTDNGRFTIDGTNLKVGKIALTEGTYKAYVLAADTKGKTFGKAITITVAKADPRYTITVSPSDKDFGSARRKYSAPAAQTITITNTGNRTMTLAQPVSTNFIIGALSRTTIERDAAATFTIQPKTGLNEGVYDETITISTGNGTTAAVAVKFTVTSALVYDLTVNESYAESTGAGTYEGDAEVNISAGTRSRYTFTGWTSSGGGTFADAGSASTTFTMPEGNVTITAAWRYNGGGSGGSGGSSSGGSSSGATQSPSGPAANIPGNGEANIPAAVDQNGNANVSVTDKNITDAITDARKDAVQGQPITVEIKVSTDKDASQLTTTLPQSARDALIKDQVGSLIIASKNVSMNFSQAALAQMNAQAQGNLIITAAKADTGKLMGNAQSLIGNRPTYDFKAICDGKIITNLGANTVTINIPYILREGEKAANIQAVRVDANGAAAVVSGSYYDAAKQVIVFATGDITATYGAGYQQAGSAHQVQRGETLAAIARRYQTTVQAIVELNNISNPDEIEIGQEIQIPQK